MSQNTLSPDDPKFTAYALGELEGEELAAAEAALRENPALRATVAEIRATATQLSTALATEPIPAVKAPASAVTPSHRAAAIPAGGDPKKRDGAPPPYERKQLIKFPQFYYIAGLAAAACFAVIAVLQKPTPHPVPVAEKQYTEITFAPATQPPAPVTKSETAAEPPVTVATATQATPSETKPAENQPKIEVHLKEETDATSVANNASLPPPVVETPVPEVKSESNNTLAVGVVSPPVNPAPAPETPVAREENPAPVVAKNSSATPPTLAHQRVPGGVDSGAIVGGLAGTAPKEDVVTLSPFTVSSARDGGYAAANTLSGSRFRSARRDELPRPPLGAQFGKGANTESYASIRDNDFLSALHHPLSTFSIDVDTAGYANLRRFLQIGTRPPRDAVRIEEMLNYFSYAYPQPKPKDEKPFAASLEVASAPWAPTHRLVRIGLKGREVAIADRPAANLVFLIDVSGSMDEPNKLPLVRESMRLAVGKLRPDDRVAIVVYAGASGLALPSTPVARSNEILEAIDSLTPGGSTNGAMGIHLAYDIAKANFVKEGLNRVILCTDGDFNVGVTSEGELTSLIRDKAESGVFLTVLGFGMGNLKDSTLEKLADNGNGSYGYIDSRREAEKLLVEQATGTLMTIAKDVKIQVEFNPAKVASYRLIGYENRLLKKEDFNNDKVDAGEIGAGHTVTALYEIVPVGAPEKPEGSTPPVDELKYQRVPTPGSRLAMVAEKPVEVSNELLTVKIRYKKPDAIFSRKLEFPLTDSGARFAEASNDFKFAAAVAGFGMILRESPHKGSVTTGDVISWATPGADDDASGRRSEFLSLVRQAQAILR